MSIGVDFLDVGCVVTTQGFPSVEGVMIPKHTVCKNNMEQYDSLDKSTFIMKYQDPCVVRRVKDRTLNHRTQSSALRPERPWAANEHCSANNSRIDPAERELFRWNRRQLFRTCFQASGRIQSFSPKSLPRRCGGVLDSDGTPVSE